MRRVAKTVAVCLLPALLLTGCWSYRSLNDIAIVMGIGVDADPEGGGFRISAEIADLTKSLQDSSPGAKIIVSQGQTFFDAIRNAKKRLNNRLYIGNIQVMVLGEELARTAGILAIVDWCMRDGEARETINLVIAKGTSAQELLSQEGLDQSIVSLEMDSIITEDNKSTSSTAHVELYEAFFEIHCPGSALTLPAFHITENDGQPIIEADGIAVFIGDKLEGFLAPEESKFLLIATNECHGGILPVALRGTGSPDTSLEIQDSRAKTSFFYRGEQLTFRIETETDVFLAETTAPIDVMDSAQIQALEGLAGKMIQERIERLVQVAQGELKADVFGFGYKIYQRDVGMWEGLKEDWEAIFPTVAVEVSSKVNIKNSAFIKTKEAVDK